MPWISTMSTNLGIAMMSAALIYLVGIQAFVLVHLPIVMFAADLTGIF
jgi:omega-6 fatty acid desaturase (delta-12 desaturase)